MTRFTQFLLIALMAAGCSVGRSLSAPTETNAVLCDSGSVAGLPIVELPSTGTSNRLAIFLSGDGGWRKIDREIAVRLNEAGIPVVGLLSNKYFSSPRTPEKAACDIDALVAHFLRSYGREKVLLIGYSRGADALPLIVNRLQPGTRERIDRLVLAGPAPTAELHYRSWWHLGRDTLPSYDLLPEMRRLSGMKILCIYGTRERESLCPLLPKGLATDVNLPGGHHFGGAYQQVADRILEP